MKTFVINLDRRQDRLEYMKKHLEFHDIPDFERISAVDYKDFVSLDENNQEYIDYEKINKTDLLEKIKTRQDFYLDGIMDQIFSIPNEDKRMTISEACVAKSHQKAWKEAMNYDYSLILEDDITFTSKMPPLLNYIENELNINFDIFLLGWATQHGPKLSNADIAFSPYTLLKIDSALLLHAYIITKNMAKQLYDATFFGPVDEYLSDLYSSINCYGIYAASQTETHLTDNIHFSDLKNPRLVI